MPHAVFNLGTQTAGVDVGARQLIPGIAPGGSRAGMETKPALLIRSAHIQLGFLNLPGTANHYQLNVFLKLSQEIGLDPGLLLHIASIFVGAAVATDDAVSAIAVEHYDDYKGSVWAPAFVGVRLEDAAGDLQGFDVDVHLNYERIDVPWMDWFIMWDFLDNVVNNEREY